MVQLSVNAKIVSSSADFINLKKRANTKKIGFYTLEEPGGVIVFKQINKYIHRDKMRTQCVISMGSGFSMYPRYYWAQKVMYTPEEKLWIDEFEASPEECAPGIHFFFDKFQAYNYQF